MGGEEATELIFKLEKYGSGWSEELFPRLTVEQRPIQKRIRVRNRSSFPDAWQVIFISSCSRLMNSPALLQLIHTQSILTACCLACITVPVSVIVA